MLVSADDKNRKKGNHVKNNISIENIPMRDNLKFEQSLEAKLQEEEILKKLNYSNFKSFLPLPANTSLLKNLPSIP